MLNKVMIQGRLVADAELRTTQNGNAVAQIRVAVDRDFKDKDSGERGADFFSVVAWRAQATFISKYFRKGSPILIDGRLQSRSYTDKDGNKRTAIEIVADNVYFAGSAPETAKGNNADNLPEPKPVTYEEADDELPF